MLKMRTINFKLIEIAGNCLIACYLLFLIEDLDLFNRLLIVKGVLFLIQAGYKKRNSSAGLEKK